ncbi:MAG: glycerol-3-phosphate 1-O-acyltransferase PlsY [Elusimicrobia bacterium]|nr:glycerol-3-phosphate 1-O-acyltransferase PlsY [Elusimicrobiota bacterium]
MTESLLLLVFAYLMGGIPSGYLLARSLSGIDIREHGSGNPGAANVYRVVGRWAGWSTLLFDAVKGYLPVALSLLRNPSSPPLALGCGLLAIVGHIWTPFLKLKGGKGVATSAGVFAALLPIPTFLSFVLFLAAVGVSGHISVGSMAAALALPILAWSLREPLLPAITATAVCTLIWIKHLPNLKRLLSGKELWFKRPP